MKRLRSINEMIITGMKLKTNNTKINTKLESVSKMLVLMDEGAKTLYLESKKKMSDLYPWIESHKMNVLTTC